MSEEEALLVLVTCPPEAAEGLARALVEQRLAACVNRIDGLRSVYRWRDAVESAEESLLLAKTTRARYAQLEAAVRARHPYELPEIVAVSLSCGLPAYLQWLAQSTR
ncbi:MAG: divalent-cation tolerance protein CutA [Sinobacteraceae bacterium]|nr:divalent-cation tolerance protein CutA [Nevskia sp.]MDI3260810.1 divalent-cation tolerance protein CutA [Nevskiaceae bacterium]